MKTVPWEDPDEAISEVCGKFLGWRVSCSWFDGDGTDDIDCKGEEEERQFDSEYGSGDNDE